MAIRRKLKKIRGRDGRPAVHSLSGSLILQGCRDGYGTRKHNVLLYITNA
jgi:hypothetical protein